MQIRSHVVAKDTRVAEVGGRKFRLMRFTGRSFSARAARKGRRTYAYVKWSVSERDPDTDAMLVSVGEANGLDGAHRLIAEYVGRA